MQEALQRDGDNDTAEVGEANDLIGFDESPSDLTREEWVGLVRQPEIAAIDFCDQIIECLKGVLAARVRWSPKYKGFVYYPRFFQFNKPGWHEKILDLWKEYPGIMRASQLEIVSGDTLLWTPKTNPYPHARKS